MRKYETILINDFMSKEIVTTVKEEDYLKVVEEKEVLENTIKMYKLEHKKIEKELKEKDEEIEKLKGNNEKWEEISLKTKQNFTKEINKKDEEIKRKNKTIDNLMKKLIKLEEKEEQLYTLKYIYDVDGVVKEYEQNGMLKEDAEELIGMDSDNWNHWSLTKEERPDKDKIVEGLLIRCESNEELIKELESRNENLEIENRQLLNDRRLKIGLSDRRA
ncbi:hypothetical protein Goe4_c00070 [Bacillus phage vB_BthP-Goe4]|uniref:Uncharacterized protein n=1 Tax=Bacillus phage vB_BthP-Goe4 TaxID=2315470 RepID=A0A386KQI1_9CAUD|nr:hypothetical protein H3015_gp38 [Bacillus phage vB_BthP-Goe4]AYD87716.1 hypothetical protein Goe4_c00070 [Bacillus phage vB_BthP-Goe4]